MEFKDLFSGHAVDYSRYRPTYPEELYRYLAEQLDRRDLAWDCATGNGQAAAGLAPWFRRVRATDASAAQISAARPLANVDYAVAAADCSGLADNSCDLVTVAQALHWFATDERFWAEVRRVIRPGGVVAAWCYMVGMVSPEIDAVVTEYYDGVLAGYWEPERRYVDENYRTIAFPLEELTPPAFEMRTDWTLSDLLGYFNSWSATRTATKKLGRSPLEETATKLAALWGDPDQRRHMRWPLHLRVGRAG